MKDENVYRKTDLGDFVPFGQYAGENFLPDGVWYVRHNNGCYSETRLDNYDDRLIRIGDTTHPDWQMVGGIREIVDRILESEEYKELMCGSNGISRYDFVQFVVKMTYKYNNELNNKKSSKHNL